MPYKIIVGKATKGQGRGKNLGFPTANIRLHKNIASGIYLSQVKVAQKLYPALTFIGIAKTYSETTYQAESYLLNFSGNLYDKWISVKLLKKIRKNIKFSSEEELIEQMRKDEKVAEEYFKSV